MTTIHASLLAGLLIGFSVAAPVGPMGLLCIQRTLASGVRIGISTGLGAATVNVLYGATILLGFGRAPAVPDGGRALGAVAIMVLLWSAARAWARARARPAELDAIPPIRSPLAAYGSAVLFNATNPMAPMLLAALLAPAAGLVASSATGVALMLLGIFAAATTWWICLSLAVGALRARLGPGALAGVNRAAGVLLLGYAVLTAWRMADGGW